MSFLTAITRREQRDLILAILVFVFVNFSIPFSIGLRWSKAAEAAATWPVVAGWISSTNLNDFRYAYEVKGAVYRHSRIRFGFLGDAMTKLPALTNGAPVKVSHHPVDPTEAVLIPEASAGTRAMKVIGMSGMIATCVAALMVWRLFPVRETTDRGGSPRV